MMKELDPCNENDDNLWSAKSIPIRVLWFFLAISEVNCFLAKSAQHPIPDLYKIPLRMQGLNEMEWYNIYIYFQFVQKIKHYLMIVDFVPYLPFL